MQRMLSVLFFKMEAIGDDVPANYPVALQSKQLSDMR